METRYLADLTSLSMSDKVTLAKGAYKLNLEAHS